jgi:4a-hydroxytetrahydrobiopterin dehydratase
MACDRLLMITMSPLPPEADASTEVRVPDVPPGSDIGPGSLDTRLAGPLSGPMSRLLSEAEVVEALRVLPDWKLVEGGDTPAIAATYEFVDFVGALDFVSRAGAEAEQMNHHPDIDIRWNTVTLVNSTHSEGGLTQLDIELAHRINEIAGHDL